MDYLIGMARVGVDDKEAMIKLFKTIHIISQDIDWTIKVFQRVIATGILSNRYLMTIGFTTKDDEEFKLMNPNQRALFLAGIIIRKGD